MISEFSQGLDLSKIRLGDKVKYNRNKTTMISTVVYIAEKFIRVPFDENDKSVYAEYSDNNISQALYPEHIYRVFTPESDPEYFL